MIIFMGKNRLILMLVLLSFVVITGCSKQTSQETKKDIGNMNEAETILKEPELLAGSISKYYAFEKNEYDKALMENKIILLYFYANWCPICKAEQPETFAAFDELNNKDIIGFRVNYKDNMVDEYEEQLAKDHGITYQHTKIILKNGERVLKAPDSWKKERYLEELRKVV